MNTFIKTSLTIMATALLSACGGGSSNDDGTNNTNNSGTTNTATTTPITSQNTSAGTSEQPSISLNGANPQFIAIGGSFNDSGASASDSADGNLSSAITESNNINTSAAGCYKQTYVVSDSDGNSNTIDRIILVGNDAERHSPNTAPITQEVAVTNAFNSISILNLLDSTFDADCDVLKVTSVSNPAVGTAKINSDGTVTYDPQGIVGSHFFTYTVSDNYGGSSTSGVSIASVDPNDGNDNWPQISGESVSTPKNTSILIDILANDFDADGDDLVLDAVDTPQHGTIEKQDGKVFYTPNVDFTGEDFFYYGVHDNHGHNGSGLTNITVTE